MKKADNLTIISFANQQAKEFFTTLNSVNRYANLFRIHTAKKPETRAARIRKFIDMLANNQKIYL